MNEWIDNCAIQAKAKNGHRKTVPLDHHEVVGSPKAANNWRRCLKNIVDVAEEPKGMGASTWLEAKSTARASFIERAQTPQSSSLRELPSLVCLLGFDQRMSCPLRTQFSQFEKYNFDTLQLEHIKHLALREYTELEAIFTLLFPWLIRPLN
jgi:hypothetical protein